MHATSILSPHRPVRNGTCVKAGMTNPCWMILWHRYIDWRHTGEPIQLHSGVWASKTMTSPIYPPQGGSSEVWSIKLSPEIKRLLAPFSRGGRRARSPYAFRSCCILFDIINMDQGVPRCTETHSPPKGNISRSNTDMIYADFNTWLCAKLHEKVHNFLQVFGGSSEIFKSCSTLTVCVCMWSQSKREYCLCAFSFAGTNWINGYASPQMYYLTPHKWSHIPMQAWSRSTGLYYIHFDSLAGAQEVKKVPHVWIKIGLYIPMGLSECYRFQKHWTYISDIPTQSSPTTTTTITPSVWHIYTVGIWWKLYSSRLCCVFDRKVLIGNANHRTCLSRKERSGWSRVILSGTKSSKCSFE